MKKSLLIIFLALFSLSALADIAPDFTLRARAPKPFFEKISSLYRRIHPDPKLEMQAAFALMPFGYPDFGGISKRENAVVCGFATETENPVYVLGFKSDGNSRMEKTLAARNIKPVKKGGYTFFSLPTDADARYIDAAFGEFSKVGHSLAEIDATPEAFNRLAKGAFGKYTADIESANVKIDADARTIKLCATVKLKKGSPLCNAVNEVRRVKEAEEAEFLPRDAEIFAITKAHLPDGIFDTQAARGVLPQRLAEKFALRDLRIVLGFGGFGNADTVFFGRSGDRLESVSFDGYRAVFGNFKKIGGREIPTKIKIEAESYTLALEFVSTLNTNRNATKQN